jgi:YesN/AraC family two-component response regulator
MSGIGNVYEAQNRDNDALSIFQEAGRLALLSGETPVYVQLMEAEQYMYEKAGRYKEAITTQKAIRHLNDSLLALDKQIAVHDLELAYNNEKLERKNESLSTNILLMKNRMRANTIILMVVLVSALVLGALLFYIYRLYRQRDSAYNTLFEKYRNDIQSAGSAEGIIQTEYLFPPMILEESSQIYQKLIEYFESEKPYLNSNLRFDDVTVQVRANRKTISDLIQQHLGMNFSTFVNNYRIKEVLMRLALPELKNYKIEAIAKQAGFGSKAAFYAAFSQATGSRPSEFR